MKAKPKQSVPLTVGGILGRQALTVLGTLAVTKGYVDAETVTQISGALLALGATAWSYWQKKRAE